MNYQIIKDQLKVFTNTTSDKRDFKGNKFK